MFSIIVLNHPIDDEEFECIELFDENLYLSVPPAHPLALFNEISFDDINENVFNKNLYHNLPDVDFLIRTSGEQRISNFMLWQISYAEFYFPKVYFPDFDTNELEKAFKEYESRDRRFGKVK